MSNPILKMLMGNSQKNSLNTIGNIIKNSNNPMAMMDSMFGNNPNYQEMKKFIDQNGGNVEQSSNDDIMKKLDEQTKEMLGDIHEQLKKINERIDSLEMGRGNQNENS